MTLKESLSEILDELPEQRQLEVLDFARFLALQRERDQWQQAALERFASAYGPDEPDYSPDDLKPERNR